MRLSGLKLALAPASRWLWVVVSAGLLVGLQACDGCDEPGVDNPIPTCACEPGFHCDALGFCQPDDVDLGDAGDVGNDVGDVTDLDVVDRGDTGAECTPATEADDCAAGQYCNEDGECEAGCRIEPDNCGDCELYPGTCDEERQCSPNSRECVLGCIEDDECLPSEYCDLETNTCEQGCRTNPDSCPEAPVGEPALVCDAATHRCIGGPCAEHEDCLEGYYCDDDFDVCIEGCRDEPDNCGIGYVCELETRACIPIECECDEDDEPETCDEQCNDGGRVSAYYCDPATQTCQLGCRIRNDGSDTCRPGTLCDAITHTCIEGCRVDADCPFGMWCDTELDDPICVPGCKEGECGKDQYCCLDVHECCSAECETDEDCWDGGEYNGLYCNGEFCEEGCIPDDEGTDGVDEDTCPGELVCNPDTRDCEIPRCDAGPECGVCPLGLYCAPSIRRCVTGCNGHDCNCPSGQVCSPSTNQCGCVSDDECPDGTHCTYPECEPDCVPASDTTEDNCPEPLVCDPLTGRCTGDCIDRSETDATSNDVPASATCIPFFAGDPLLSLRDCTDSMDPKPCDGEADTWCEIGTACTGADFDWYVMFLRAGDIISAYALDPGISWDFLTLVLFPERLGDGFLRQGTELEDDDGIGFEHVVIEADGLYYLRLFTDGSNVVEYDLEVHLERPFVCIDDSLEDNDSTIQAVQVAPPGRLANRTYGDLSICAADRDFFSLFLFNGQRVTAVTDSEDGHPGLAMAMGTDGGVDLEAGAVDATAYTDPLDPDDPDDRVIYDHRVSASDEYFVRVNAADGLSEASYSFHMESSVGDASCEPDDFEDGTRVPGAGERYRNNNTPEDTDEHRISLFAPRDLNTATTFESASLCPATTDPVTPIDVDYYMVQVWPGKGGGFLQAAIIQAETALELEIFEWRPTGVGDARELVAMATVGVETGQILTTSALYDRVDDSPTGPAAIYFVRVGSTDPGDDELLPLLGESYTLLLDYVGTPCEDDRLEPSSRDSLQLLHRETLLAGWGAACSDPFTATCIAGVGTFCECLPAHDLVMCPTDDEGDWYRFRLLDGDQFTVRVHVTGLGAAEKAALMGVRVYFPSCADLSSCADMRNVRPGSGSPDFIFSGTAAAPPGQIIGTYILEVDAGALIEGADYDIDIEIDGAGGRDCPPSDRPYDPWDLGPEDWDRYPGPNDSACTSDSCVLEPGSSAADHDGSLCTWDRQDWFKFINPSESDVELYIQFEGIEGKVVGEVYPVPLPDGSDMTIFGCGHPTPREDCECATGFDPEGRTVCRLIPTRPEMSADFPGVEYAIYDLPAATYQIRVRPDPILGQANPRYTIAINDDACGGTMVGTKVLWSNSEECDAGRIAACGGAACVDCECGD